MKNLTSKIGSPIIRSETKHSHTEQRMGEEASSSAFESIEHRPQLGMQQTFDHGHSVAMAKIPSRCGRSSVCSKEFDSIYEELQ